MHCRHGAVFGGQRSAAIDPACVKTHRDRQEPSEALQTKTNRLKEKIETLKQQMRCLERLKVEMLATPDQQISLTDPDARSMATSGRGSGVVGYNVQIAVEANHHLIVCMR